MKPLPIVNVRVHAGRGVSGDHGTQAIRLGSPAFLAESGVAIDAAELGRVQAAGQTVVGVAEGLRLVGWITLVDALRRHYYPGIFRRGPIVDPHAGAAAARQVVTTWH